MSRPGPPKGDDGYSLIEMLVVLGIMSIVGIIFTTGVMQIYRASGAAEADSTTESQLSQALLRLDTQIRYAYSIGAVHNEGTPALPYVEFLTMAPGSGTTYVKRCVQLRLAGSGTTDLQLQTRSWAPTFSPSAWVPLASGLSVPSGAAAFTRVQPTLSLDHQLLTLRLSATSGGITKTSSITFTALNTYARTALDSSRNSLPVTSEPCYDAGARS
jgi:prepilin-type N-terminal cleavage/methylation domain-containing protein